MGPSGCVRVSGQLVQRQRGELKLGKSVVLSSQYDGMKGGRGRGIREQGNEIDCNSG